MSEETIYKVVRRQHDGSFGSAIVPMTAEGWYAIYEIGKRTYPAKGYDFQSYLFAFMEENQAYNFALLYQPASIFRAQAVVVRRENVDFTWPLYTPKYFERYWRKEITNLTNLKTLIPRGTVWCEWIMPTELIKELGYDHEANLRRVNLDLMMHKRGCNACYQGIGCATEKKLQEQVALYRNLLSG